MENSQLIEIVRSLTKKEIRELKKWLASPAHNHRQDVIKLFQYLIIVLPREKSKYLAKDHIYEEIYPREPYDDAKLRQLVHILTKEIETYLLFTLSAEDEIGNQINLATSYRARGLDKSYHKLVKSVSKSLERSPIKDEMYYHNVFLLSEEKYNELGSRQSSQADFQGIVDNLEISFIIRKLRFAGHMLNHENKVKKEYNYGLLEPVLKFIDDNDLTRIPSIKIYYYLYLATRFPEKEEYYYNFKESIFEYDNILPKSEMRDNYLQAVNYSITRANQSVKGFKREVFDLYKQGIENKVLFDDEGRLSTSTFRNTVNMGTVVKEFEWIYSFIKNYQKYLPEDQREETVQFSLGKYYFEKGEYDKAQDYLITINPGAINLNLMIRSMLIRIYYSQDEFMLLDALLESMKVYINRKKQLAPQYRKPFLNLIKYTKKLVKVNPYDKSAKAKLRTEIEEARPLIAKDWFLEQVDLL